MILKDGKNDFKKFDNDYMKLTDFENIKALEIMKYLSVSRIGLSLNPAIEDFKYKKKTEGEITLVNAKCCHDEYKEYTILLRGNHLLSGFDNDKVYLIDEKNILSINNGNLEHYNIYNGMRIVNSFPINLKSMGIRNFAKNHIIINGRIYDIRNGRFTTPEFDEIITPGDYNDSDSIIFVENICPKELRIALQNVVKNGDVSLGINQVIAAEPLIDLEKEEYLKTIVIRVITKFNDCYFDYFYYDPLNNKMMSNKTYSSFDDATSEVKKRLNEITDFLNRKKREELEYCLYVDATEKISSILPKENRKRVLETNGLIKKYKNASNK